MWKAARRSLFSIPLAVALIAGGCGTRPDGEVANHHDDELHAEHGEGDHLGSVVQMSPEKLALLDLETGRAEHRVLAARLAATGQVGYDEERLAHVSPRIPGRVVRVPARLGDQVHRGQVLAVIDSVELGKAKAAYLAALAAEELAAETYEREKTLYEDRITSQQEMLEARTRFLQAVTERERSQETLRLYGVGGGEIASLHLGDPGASLLAVRSPVAGEVVEKHATLGELVTPEQSLFTVADLDRVWIWVDVYEQDLALVHVDDGVEMRVEAFPGRTFEGTIAYLSPNVENETRTLRARIDAENLDRALRPGMFAELRLTDPHTGGTEETLTIPQAALQRRGAESIVFLPLGDGRFTARVLTLGRTDAGWVEVLSGLDAGDTVVTEGSFFLKSELAREELGGGHGH